MRMPMIENIVHTAKQTVKAMVDNQRARCAVAILDGEAAGMGGSEGKGRLA
jgi:hypothetical protein